MLITGEAVHCGNPGVPMNGRTTLISDTLGSIVNYTCNEGYELNGVNQRGCLANGSWSFTLPDCDGK